MNFCSTNWTRDREAVCKHLAPAFYFDLTSCLSSMTLKDRDGYETMVICLL